MGEVVTTYVRVGSGGVAVVCGSLIKTHSAPTNQGGRHSTSSIPWRQLNTTTLELLWCINIVGSGAECGFYAGAKSRSVGLLDGGSARYI